MKELINKLPFILPAIMALVSGILGLYFNKSMNFIYSSMLVSILIFYILGLVAKNFILGIIKDEDSAIETEVEDISDEKLENAKTKGNVIDLKVDDSNDSETNNFYGDDFSPLEISKVIRTNIDRDEK